MASGPLGDYVDLEHTPAQPWGLTETARTPADGIAWRYWSGRLELHLAYQMDESSEVVNEIVGIDVARCSRDEFTNDLKVVSALVVPDRGNDTSNFRGYFANLFRYQASYVFPEAAGNSTFRSALRDQLATCFAQLGVTHPNGIRWDYELAGYLLMERP